MQPTPGKTKPPPLSPSILAGGPIISTVVGSLKTGYATFTEGPALVVVLRGTSGLLFDAAGDLVFTSGRDDNNGLVLKVSPPPFPLFTLLQFCTISCPSDLGLLLTMAASTTYVARVLLTYIPLLSLALTHTPLTHVLLTYIHLFLLTTHSTLAHAHSFAHVCSVAKICSHKPALTLPLTGQLDFWLGVYCGRQRFNV